MPIEIDCDHDWKYFDDSFSHEYGTEICGYWECTRCNAVDENREPPQQHFDDVGW